MVGCVDGSIRNIVKPGKTERENTLLKYNTQRQTCLVGKHFFFYVKL